MSSISHFIPIVIVLLLSTTICSAKSTDSELSPSVGNSVNREYIVLQKNKPLNEQLTYKNATYEVRYSYNLDGKTVTIPSGCNIRFTGGMIDNGILKGDLTSVDAANLQIFGHNLLLAGSWSTNSLNVCWFGAKNDISFNSTQAFITANKCAWNISEKKKEYEYYGETKTVSIIIPTGVYYVTGNGLLGSIREENNYPNYNTNTLYKIEGNNSILYWEVNKEDDVLFRFDYSIGHQSISDLKIFVVNNTREDFAGIVFKIGNKLPKNRISGHAYSDAGLSHYSEVHVVNSRKGQGGIYKVFDVIGSGQCDQALAQRCTFEGFLYGFYNTNPEAVSWNFETCSFFTTAKEAKYFYITRLRQYLMVNNSTFSYCDGQTLCEYNCELSENKKLLGNDRDNIIFNNTRFEGYVQNKKEWFLVYKGTAGKLILQNCNFDASSSSKITHKFLLSDLGSVYISNTAIAKTLFTIPKFTSRSYGLGDQNNWAIVSDNFRCDHLVFKGYDWDNDKLTDITDAYLSKGSYYRYADFKDLRGKSAKGFKLQSFYITPNTLGEVQYDVKTTSYVMCKTSLSNDILLPPFCVVKKIDIYDKGSIPSNVSRIRIYAGEKKNGVYIDVPIKNNSGSLPVMNIFQGSILVFDEDINKQFLYCSYITDQGEEINVNSGSLALTYIPLTDPSVYSIKGPASVIIKE